MASSDPAPVVVDAGGLIAVERRSVKMAAAVDEVEISGGLLVVPAPVLAQVWCGDVHQAILSRFLNLPFVEVDLLTRAIWQTAGMLCGQAGTSDVVDAAVVACARSRAARVVVTTDPDDLRRLDRALAYQVP